MQQAICAHGLFSSSLALGFSACLRRTSRISFSVLQCSNFMNVLNALLSIYNFCKFSFYSFANKYFLSFSSSSAFCNEWYCGTVCLFWSDFCGSARLPRIRNFRPMSADNTALVCFSASSLMACILKDLICFAFANAAVCYLSISKYSCPWSSCSYGL